MFLSFYFFVFANKVTLYAVHFFMDEYVNGTQISLLSCDCLMTRCKLISENLLTSTKQDSSYFAVAMLLKAMCLET